MRGDGGAELTGYDSASVSCLGSMHMKPDQTVYRKHQPGMFSLAPFRILLQFVIDCFILLQRSCPVLCINILLERNCRLHSCVRIKQR